MGKEKILIIDDSRDLLFLVSTFLKRAGFEVITANDGLEGLKAIQLNDNIKLIFLDMMMPKLSGLEFLLKAVNLKPEMGFKICAMTAKEEKSHVKECLRKGADDYIVKPVDGPLLIDKAKILLSHADANDFCSVDIKYKGKIEMPEGKLEIDLLKISESSLVISSKIKLPDGARIFIASPELEKLLGRDSPLLLRIYKSERNGSEFTSTGTFIALKDNEYKKIRTVTTKGK